MPAAVTFEHYEVMTRDDGSLCELGRGAMGITYKGFDTRLRVPVALKVINAAHLHSDTARQRFVREARSAARLRHRNVASVFHLGQEGDNYFYAMEFIDGETVDARVKKHGALAPSLVLKIGAQVARALNAAQTHELVHRDIKPANLMLVHEDDELIVKVIDFGLAKIVLGGGGEDAATLTMSGFLGTPHFASPEQLEEREIDVRSDIYSLGITLWFALTGKTPFSGSVMQVMSQHITRQPPWEQLENVPQPVVDLLRGMLDKNPAQRPQTAIELRREIERCLARIGDSDDISQDAPPAKIGDTPTVSESDETQFETGAAIGTRFIITEQTGETEAGRVFRAHDGVANRDVRLVALDRDLMADTDAIAQIESDAAALVALAHPNVLGIYGVTNDGRAAYLTMEWIDGFSLRDLLRARRELSLAEVLQLMPGAASGVDAAQTVQSDRLVVTLPQLAVHFPGCQIATENLLRRPVAEWPDFQVKFNALPISRDRFALTWDGAQTIVGKKGGPTGDGSPAHARIVHEFAAIAYEMLGGSPEAIGPQRYTPLASLDEAGNELLRRGIIAPESFASAAEFARAFSTPPQIAPIAPIRTAAATTTPETPQTEIRITAKSAEPEIVPAPPNEIIPPEPATETPAPAPTEEREPEAVVAEVAPPPPIPQTETPAPEPEPAAVAAAEPTAPEPAPAEFPKRRKLLPLAIAAVLALLAGLHVFQKKNDNRPIVKNPPAANPAPVKPDPIPAPVPVPPPPTRMELANEARKAAEAFEAKQANREALAAWLAFANDFPEFKPGKNGLETLIQRLRNRPGGFPRAEFDAMRDELTKAAKLDVLAAMMMLGEQLITTEPIVALEWYSAAAEKGDPVAMLQTARLLAAGTGSAADPGKVVSFLTSAADQGEPNAMMTLAGLHLNGQFGVEKNFPRAIELLKAAVEKENSRAMILLGDCFHKGIAVTRNDKEAFRLFSKASEDRDAVQSVRAEAIGNLGVLYMKGEGVPKKDERLGAQKLRTAAELGDSPSMHAYALVLLGGMGVPSNSTEARVWFRKAAEAGHEKAAEWCKTNGEPFNPPGNR